MLDYKAVRRNSNDSSLAKEEGQEDLAFTVVQEIGWALPGIKVAARSVKRGAEHGPERC